MSIFYDCKIEETRLKFRVDGELFLAIIYPLALHVRVHFKNFSSIPGSLSLFVRQKGRLR